MREFLEGLETKEFRYPDEDKLMVREFLEGLETTRETPSLGAPGMVREFLEGLETRLSRGKRPLGAGGARVPRRA